MLRPLLIILASSNIIFANEISDKANELGDKLSDKTDASIQKTKNKIPALEILPAGSILKKISIPRYNPDYTPSSLLLADQVKIISEEEIEATNVCLTLYNESGEMKSRASFSSANYNQSTGLITTKENLEFSGETFTASSQGLILDWENQRGFLLGKNNSLIYIAKRTVMKNTTQQNNNNKKSSNATSIAAASAAVVLANSPTFLTAQELAQIDSDSKPSTELFIQQLEETKASLIATAEAEEKIAAIRKELSDKIGTVPAVNAAQPIPPELVPIKGRDFIRITSDQLMFDAKKGIFVYFGNVKITHPQYSFTCDGELKIILSESAAAKKLSPEERAKLKANDLFDDVKQIIANNNVIVRGKDKKGKDVTAITENLSYIKTTGDIILKGKGSRITTADSQLKVVTNNGYLKLDQDFNASGQGTNTDFSLPEDKDKKGNKNNPKKP